MRANRKTALERSKTTQRFGLIQGTLGRQGSPSVINHLTTLLEKTNKDYIVVLLSEITGDKLRLFGDVGCWIQVACPRLSIDWGHFFEVPLLTPYEAVLVLSSHSVGDLQWLQDDDVDVDEVDDSIVESFSSCLCSKGESSCSSKGESLCCKGESFSKGDSRTKGESSTSTCTSTSCCKDDSTINDSTKDDSSSCYTKSINPSDSKTLGSQRKVKGVYPMDFYASDSLGPWTPNYKPPKK